MKRLPRFDASIRLRLGHAAILACAIPGIASAQTGSDTAAAATAAQPEHAQEGMTDIVVTARRRQERLQEIPVAVSVLAGPAVHEAGIQRFEDLQRSVPALQVQGSNYGNASPSFTIRSQRSGDSIITNDPSVSVYLAEVPEARTQGLSGGMFDVSSIQVLKGPQGTLFGRNTTGGAVVITPQAPTDRFEGYGRATFGNYGTHDFEGVVNAPLADWAQLRVGGVINRHDGYVRNLLGGRLNDANNESWRVSLKLTPFDGFRNTTVLNGWHSDETGPAARPTGAGPIATLVFPTFAGRAAAAMDLPFFTVANNGPPANGATSFLLSNITEWDLTDNLTLKNIFGYRRVLSHSFSDLDGTDVLVYQDVDLVRSRQYSDELQLSGKAFDSHLDYIVGAFYFKEKASEEDTSFRVGALSATTFIPNSVSVFAGNTDSISKSIFAQSTLRIPGLEKLSLTAGGRYTWDDRELTQRNKAGTYDPATLGQTLSCSLLGAGNAVLNPCARNLSADFQKFTYTLAVDYKITRDVLVYFTHRTGYRAGGFNLRANPLLATVPFRPENVKDFEIGLKSEFGIAPDVRLRFNIAAYYQDYKNIQRSIGILDPNTGRPAGSRIENAASAHVKGVEPELTLFVGDSFSINGYYSYSKGKYINYLSVNNATGRLDDLTPSPFAGAPVNSGGVNVSWKLPVLKDQGEVKLVGNFYAQSMTFGSDNTYTVAGGISPFNKIPGYHVVNGRLEWNHIKNSSLSAALYARNIFNEKYYIGALDVINQGLGTGNIYVADPRTFGGEITYRW